MPEIDTYKSAQKVITVTVKANPSLPTVGTTLTSGKNSYKVTSVAANAKIKVPEKKLSTYKKLLKGKGQGSKVKITK